MPVDTITWPSSYVVGPEAASPSEPVSLVPGNDPLYPRTTYNLPLKSLSLEGLSLDALCTNIYSVENPVSVTFLRDIISPVLPE